MKYIKHWYPDSVSCFSEIVRFVLCFKSCVYVLLQCTDFTTEFFFVIMLSPNTTVILSCARVRRSCVFYCIVLVWLRLSVGVTPLRTWRCEFLNLGYPRPILSKFYSILTLLTYCELKLVPIQSGYDVTHLSWDRCYTPKIYIYINI